MTTLEEQKAKDDTLKKQLFVKILENQNMAEWIFYDAFYNCDGQAASRTAQRLHLISMQHDKDVLFGIAGYWAMRGYWKIQEASVAQGILTKPDILPVDTNKILESDGPETPKRAYVSAQQFVSTMTHGNILMAKAIFDVAFDAGIEDYVSLMQNILLISMRFTAKAQTVLAV